MRIVEVEEKSARGHWVLWTLGGAAVGVGVGVLLSEKLSGRDGGARTLWRRARSLVKIAGKQWMPVLGLVMELRDRWAERGADDDDNVELDEEYEETSGEFAIPDGDDDSDDDDADDDDEGDDDDEANDDPIGSRVLEAFLNDPILAERAIEIDGDSSGNVFLHGRVWTAREVAHAVTIAGGVPGVTGVRQRIRVRDRR